MTLLVQGPREEWVHGLRCDPHLAFALQSASPGLLGNPATLLTVMLVTRRPGESVPGPACACSPGSVDPAQRPLLPETRYSIGSHDTSSPVLLHHWSWPFHVSFAASSSSALP